MDYSEAQAFLFQRLPMFQRVGAVAYKADLNNTIKLLEGIGNPHLKFKSVHIAGTNGKGTSAHSIAAILQSAGYKTGLYTSPHLKSFTERVKINGQEISKDEVAEFVTASQLLIEAINPSFFEVTVALAFNHFAEKRVDIAIIETGLGGRLDSTNVIDPLVSLITMIDFDHAEILGDTLEAIAKEKAGIIKPSRPVIIGSDQPDIFAVFQDKANEVNAPLFQSTQFKVVDKGLNEHHRAFDVVGWREDLSRFTTDIIASYYLKRIEKSRI
jgi:dihydrofolate synthase/folylpolyglutamate synthase